MSSKSFLVSASLAALLGVTAMHAVHAEPASVPSKNQLAALCKDCAWVSGVRSEERKGEASGVGVVGGAVIGGLLGNRVGGGTGKALMTAGGAVAGGYAGNEIEKNSKKHRVWIVQLVHKDGHRQTRELNNDPQLRAGDVVFSKNGRLERR